MKRKVGRPRKINYTPTIQLTYSKDLIWDILRIKRNLGMHMTIGELSELINHELTPYGLQVIISIEKKEKWYNKVLNWFRNLKK